MQAYPVVVHKDVDSDYGTVVPDLRGCYSGATLSEALDETREAICAHPEGIAKDGEAFPQPSNLSAIQESGDYTDAIAFATVEICP